MTPEDEDTLISSRAREASFFAYLDGIRLVEKIFAIPLAQPSNTGAEDGISRLISTPRMRNPDALFAALFSMSYPPSAAIDPLYIDFRTLSSTAFSPSEWIWDPLLETIGQLHSLDDRALLDRVESDLEVQTRDLTAPIERDCFTYLKINHGFWEHLTLLYFTQEGIPYYREIEMKSRARYYASGFLSLLSRAIRKQQTAGLSGRPALRRFAQPDFEIGISLNAGDQVFAKDLKTPLGAVQRGAMVGILAYLRTTMGSQRYIFADGAGPKQLVYRNRLGEFVDALCSVSECVVFIVPPHLRTINLTRSEKPVVRIIIPGRLVHELWPVVLPYVAGSMQDVFRRFRNVTIFIQAAVMSVPIGILIDQLRDTLGTATPLRLYCFDLGQVLDLATSGEAHSGGWVKRIRGKLVSNNFPFSTGSPLR